MYQKWLQAFHTVAMTGGFTRAAETLNVGQPTISTHVKALEDYFRVELFHRRGRTVKLTPTGERLLTITRGLYVHEEEALALLRATRDLETGQLTLNAVGPFDVMEILQVFRRQHPGITTRVTLGFEEEILEGLRDFHYDVGVLGREVDDPQFHCKFYNRHRVLVIVHAEHRLARRRSIRLEELDGVDMVLRPTFSTTRQAFDQALTRAGVQVNPVMEINSREANREAVLRGFGAGVISETEFAPSPSIKTLRVSNAEMFTKAFLVCLAERRDRPLIAGFFRTAASIDQKCRGVL
ncbi:MAG: LysR substrate-binding domain-containing protein [Gammaproteobacteria bacterium]|nr:LysR substrate-binding domain-containing protein [Gammaproteobacteria bacterium]